MQNRPKGLWMFCDEALSQGNHLKHKRSHIFVMEGAENIDEDDYRDEAELVA